MTVAPNPPSYALVVPVKTLSRAKSRLQGHPRPDLMRAFALDALTAALASPLVGAAYVVTDEAELADDVRALGCTPVADHGAGDLNRALSAAVAELDPARPVAAMLGDLPCLLTDDLTAALDWIGRAGSGFVGDAAGVGSTLLAVDRPADFDPRFGPGSWARHLGSGVPQVPLDVPSLRRDVDTADDLALAFELGVGQHTQAVLARH
jgi:2-phospho-L-lactate guanylyltransferase